jgi:hypothetical protein
MHARVIKGRDWAQGCHSIFADSECQVTKQGAWEGSQEEVMEKNDDYLCPPSCCVTLGNWVSLSVCFFIL